MTGLMGDHITQPLPDHLLRKRQFSSPRIESAALNKIPVLDQFKDVVSKHHFGGYDLPASRIMDMRTHGIFHFESHPADHRIAGILRVPRSVFLCGRRIPAKDSILEADGFKRDIPILNLRWISRLLPSEVSPEIAQPHALPDAVFLSR
jgi:hypothetical protein